MLLVIPKQTKYLIQNDECYVWVCDIMQLQLTDLTPSKPVDLSCGTIEHLNVRRPVKRRKTQQQLHTDHL